LLPGAATISYPASAYKQLLLDWPGILIFPEQETTANWAYGVPFTDIRNYDPANGSFVEPLLADLATYPNAQGIVQLDDASINTEILAEAAATAILHNQFVFCDVATPLAGNSINFAIQYYKILYSHPTRTIK
jgi:hypothetical protein